MNISTYELTLIRKKEGKTSFWLSAAAFAEDVMTALALLYVLPTDVGSVERADAIPAPSLAADLRKIGTVVSLTSNSSFVVIYL